MDHSEREQLASRLGFLLLSAGCAIGLGNIWRFPYIAGQYGGAIFLIAYFFFLLAVGLPIMVMEFSAGRASQKTMGRAFKDLSTKNSIWAKFGWFGYVGPMVLMMFYIPVASWLTSYCYYMVTGELSELNPEQVASFFTNTLDKPIPMFLWSLGVLFIGFGVCSMGLQKGAERIVKILMIGLLAILIVLAVNSLLLSGAKEGLAFFLAPDLERAKEAGIWNLLNAAMTQAFFTLSVGMGGMMIFGSYLNKNRSLTGEAVHIAALDTFVAIMAGVIIFPACFTFGIEPNAGPPLIFITLPNVFNAMAGGYFWGILFFVFMACAALTTVIAVIESIISYSIDSWGWSRKKALNVNCVLLFFLMLPCILGFNLWADVQPFGEGSNILDLEDFIVSNNVLPIGALVVLLFCTSRYGWGFDNFVKEADTGVGTKFPRFLRAYLTYVLPFALVVIILQGYMRFF